MEKPRPGGGRQAACSASRCALQGQRLGAVRLRDAGVADQHVSQTAVCDTRAKTPSGARRRVSYPVSDSMSCIRQAGMARHLRDPVDEPHRGRARKSTWHGDEDFSNEIIRYPIPIDQ